ncbi:MAG: hypothetical protein EOM59_10560 [Clostridia bacterium]|nr:hypothetical protein [Clostridia bacterium]
MILESHVILNTMILLALMLALTFLNVWLLVRRRANIASRLFHISSLLGLVGMFCTLMERSILGLPFKSYFQIAGSIAFTLCGIVFLGSFLTFFIMKKKNFQSFRFSPDLRAVFTSIEDLALILDYKGSVVESNDPKKMEDLFGDCSSLHTMMSNVGQEIFFSKAEEDYLVKMTPIIDKESCLGYTLVAQNITEKKTFEKKMKENNKRLEDANQKLLAYMKIGHVLEAEKARLNILEQVQVGLIKKIEQVITHLQDIRRKGFDKDHNNRNEILGLAEILRNAYKEMRISIRQISDDEKR